MTDVLSVLIISICSLITFRNIRDARNRKVYVVRSHLELKPTAMVLLKIGFSVITITIFIIVCIMQLHTTRYAENQLIRMIFPMWLFVRVGVCKIVSL
jgi:E3 ubiquitin-protein ligase DOA10